MQPLTKTLHSTKQSIIQSAEALRAAGYKYSANSLLESAALLDDWIKSIEKHTPSADIMAATPMP